MPNKEKNSKIAIKHKKILALDATKMLRDVIKNCSTEMLEVMINLGADVTVNDNEVLLYAITKGKDNAIRLLIKAGANIFARDNEPLIRAVKTGDLLLVKYLLEKGANINAQDNKAIKEAFLNGNTPMVKLLLEKGADVNSITVTMLNAKNNDTYNYIVEYIDKHKNIS